MKKGLITIFLVAVLLLSGCRHNTKPVLGGTYQSETGVGKTVQVTFQPSDSSFVEYIDNREVDKGTYEKAENNVYKIKSDKQDFEITLSKDDSFEVTVKKLNNGNPMQVKNIDKTPAYFSTKFNDVDEYKALLE